MVKRVNKGKNYRTLRVPGRVYNAPVLMSLLRTSMRLRFRNILLLLSVVFSSVVNSMEVEINMIPDFHDFLKEQAIEKSWGVFIPKQPASNSSDHLNIQFSFEGGKIGLDWVLLSPVNIRDREKFEKFANESGFKFELVTSSNDIEYLRIEQQGIKEFCGKIFTELYGLKLYEKVEFYSGGYGE